MKRTSRACVRCRQHKAKCILERSGHILVPPCQKCVQAGIDCVLATSNRGGPRRRRTGNLGVGDGSTPGEETVNDSTPGSRETDVAAYTEAGPANIEDAFTSADLHGTSDALNILSQLADSAASNVSRSRGEHVLPVPTGPGAENYDAGLLEYHLVRAGLLTTNQVADLVERFAALYHPFYPIAPAKALDRASIGDTARLEPHLFTAMITVASSMSATETQAARICGRYMRSLMAELGSGKKCSVEAVEALLLIAEWEPQCILPDSFRLGCGQEDLAAWMHIGTAIRLAQSLKLDRMAIGQGSDRARLAWTACYLSDRQISVRLGHPFACRGLEPTILYGRHGFLAVDSQRGGGDDFASVFRARLELTQIFTNVHEVLYCGRELGSYTTYLDDFRGAVAAWHSVWGSLTCSPNVKVLLQLSYEYLRLYTNAFAFQAAAHRTLSADRGPDAAGIERLGGTGALPEARFMYEAVDAAKSLLTVVNNYIPSGRSINDFPVRFPLYCVNAAVFLYKTWTMNLHSLPEKTSVRRLITDTISRLREGDSRPLSIGHRYAHLLEVLWRRTDKTGVTELSAFGFEASSHQNPPVSEQQPWLDSGFSWLDLQALGDFIWGESPRLEDRGFENNRPSEDAAYAEYWDDLGRF